MLTDTVAFPAYTRAAIDDAGLFDEELVRNQDDEYHFRLPETRGQDTVSQRRSSPIFMLDRVFALCGINFFSMAIGKSA